MNEEPDEEELTDEAQDEQDALDAEAQRLLEKEVAADLLEDGPNILGHDLRPVTLASVALLMQTDSDLIKGKPVEECENILLDCCRFIRLQTLPLREAARLVRDPEELDAQSLEFADQIPPGDVQGVINQVTKCLRDASEHRVEPSDEDAKEELQHPDEAISGEA